MTHANLTFIFLQVNYQQPFFIYAV